MKKILSALAIILGLSAVGHAQIFPNGSGYRSYNGYLSNETALAYNKNFSIDLSPYVANDVAAQVVYGSATIADVTFVAGAQSTGAVAVVNYLGLSTAAATDKITIVSTNNLGGMQIRVNNNVLVNGTDWFTGATKQLTAVSLASAVSLVPGVTASAAGGIVYATATTAGSLPNSWVMTSNNSSATVSTARFINGSDAAVLTINGVALTSGRDWFASVSSNTTALSLSSAIRNNSSLSPTVTASTGVVLSSVVVNIQSLLNGSIYNYTLQTSTPPALALIVRGASTTTATTSMTGGVASNITLGSGQINLGSQHNLTLGLPVLYSTGGASASFILGGLVNQTTYYAVPVTSYYFKLALYSTSAVAGSPASDFITITSTIAESSANMQTFNLHPLAISGTPGFKWQVSNDNATWIDLSVSSVTVTSYTAGNAAGGWDFGALGLKYLRLNATAPSTGGLVLQTVVNLKQ